MKRSRQLATALLLFLAGNELLYGDERIASSSLPSSLAEETGNSARPGSSGTPIHLRDLGSAQPEPFAETNAPTFLGDVLPIFMGKCARCHNDQTRFLYNWMDYKTAYKKRSEIKKRVWDSWKQTYYKQPMPIVNSPECEAITPEERRLICDWVAQGAPQGSVTAFGKFQSTTNRVELGKHVFTMLCAACHQSTAQGLPGQFPPLANSDFLNADKHRAIKIVLNGLQGEVTVNGRKFNNVMPKFPLSDDEIACALTFVYRSFGNSGTEVTPQEVSTIRAEGSDAVVAGHKKAGEETSPYE